MYGMTLVVMGCLLALMMTKATKEQEYRTRVDEVLSKWLADGDEYTFGRPVDYLRIPNGKRTSIRWTSIIAVYDTTIMAKAGWALPEWSLGDNKGRGPRAAVFLVDGHPDAPGSRATMVTQAIRKNIVRSMNMLASSGYLEVIVSEAPPNGVETEWLAVKDDKMQMEFEISRDKVGQDGQEQTAPYRMVDCKVTEMG